MGKKDVTAKEAHLRQYKTTALWNEHRLTILSYGNDNYILKYQYQIILKKSGTIFWIDTLKIRFNNFSTFKSEIWRSNYFWNYKTIFSLCNGWHGNTIFFPIQYLHNQIIGFVILERKKGETYFLYIFNADPLSLQDTSITFEEIELTSLTFKKFLDDYLFAFLYAL